MPVSFTGRWAGPALAAVLAGAPGSATRAADPPPHRILVEPTVPVSRDGPMSHVETAAAVTPADPKAVLAAAIVFGAGPAAYSCHLYESRDGGYSWAARPLPESSAGPHADPQLAFGPDGVAYFLMLGPRDTDFYRSADGGRGWQRVPGVPRLGDYGQLAVDRTAGKFRGRVYVVSTEVDRAGPWAGVTRSADGGRAFGPLARLPSPAGAAVVKPLGPLVLADGTLVVPEVTWDPRPKAGPPVRRLYLVTSTDGGETFSAPAPVGESAWGGREQLGLGYDPVGGGLSGGAVALAAGPDGRGGTRIWAAWTDLRPEGQRVVVRSSADGGRTWTDPVAAGPAAVGQQYQLMLAVNTAGTAGLAWLDTRADPKGGQADLYFTASADGGKTFLPARVASAAAAPPGGPGDRALWQNFTRPVADGAEVHFLSAAKRWPDGGDYAAMVVAADGAFRPVWADARTGTFQVYTTRVRVLPAAQAAAALREPAGLVERPLHRELAVVCDPPAAGAPVGEVLVRLRNTSAAPVFGPLRVKVVRAENAEVADAELDFSRALGDLPYLPPGGLTGPVKLRLRLADPGPGRLPVLTLSIAGRVAPAAGGKADR